MTTEHEEKGQSVAVVLTDLWRRWRQPRNAAAELKACGPDIQPIAVDLGLTPAELQVIVAKRPDAAGLLTARLTALHLDAGKARHENGPVFRDLQRICAMCGSKTRCARDLAADPSSSEWQTYCPNTSTLNSLAAQADEEKAIARLMRRQAHRLNALRSS